jgi:YfiH family protein
VNAAAPLLLEVPVDAPVRAVFTTRVGGVSVGRPGGLNLGAEVGDEDGAVRANRALLAAHVRRVAAPTRPGRFTGGLRGWPEGDGLATATPGLPLLVLGADCVPVLLWRRDVGGCAAAHAGWRGLVAGVVRAAVGSLGDPARVGAAVGPAVGPCCYPVDAALRDRFAARFGPETVRPPAVDLAGAARSELIAAGVPCSAIQVLEACTSCEAGRFFSHRRDGAGAGRQAGLVWATGEPGP